MIFGEDDSQPTQPRPQQQPQQLRLDIQGMETVYANVFAIGTSAEEVTLHLGTSSALPGANEPMVRLSHRVMLLPQNAKRLLQALQQTIKAHEDRFGPIEVAPPRPPQGPKS